MWTTAQQQHGPDSQRSSGGGEQKPSLLSHHGNQVPFSGEMTRMMTARSSARFGSLSHHSFFSRHNPHPHRVRHFQGLNGSPVCMVKDDWCVTTALCPHPLIKSQVFSTAAAASSSAGAAATAPLHALTLASNRNNRAVLLSEAWKDELKELSAKVSLSSQAKKDRKCEEQPEEGPGGGRKTQYSTQTGRILPPSTKAYQRRSQCQRLGYPQPLQDQELMVLELLCQILQTDSLSLVQRWLLLSGPREKDLVMGMIGQALEDIRASGGHDGEDFHHLQVLRDPSCTSSLHAQGPPGRKPHSTSSGRTHKSSSCEDKPERIGEAEVLRVHPQDLPLQTDENSFS